MKTTQVRGLEGLELKKWKSNEIQSLTEWNIHGCQSGKNVKTRVIESYMYQYVRFLPNFSIR